MKKTGTVETIGQRTGEPAAAAVCSRPGLAGWCAKVRDLLTPERFGHVMRVTELAHDLAVRNGFTESETQATLLAAVLHDAARELPAEEMFRLAPPRSEMEIDYPLTVHGRAARRMAELWDVTDERVLAAVEGHVFGVREDNRIGVAVYVADVSEPGRKVNAHIRELALTDLAAAYRLAVRAKVEYLRSVGKPIHPDTLQAYEETHPAP